MDTIARSWPSPEDVLVGRDAETDLGAVEEVGEVPTGVVGELTALGLGAGSLGTVRSAGAFVGLGGRIQIGVIDWGGLRGLGRPNMAIGRS